MLNLLLVSIPRRQPSWIELLPNREAARRSNENPLLMPKVVPSKAIITRIPKSLPAIARRPLARLSRRVLAIRLRPLVCGAVLQRRGRLAIIRHLKGAYLWFFSSGRSDDDDVNDFAELCGMESVVGASRTRNRSRGAEKSG